MFARKINLGTKTRLWMGKLDGRSKRFSKTGLAINAMPQPHLFSAETQDKFSLKGQATNPLIR